MAEGEPAAEVVAVAALAEPEPVGVAAFDPVAGAGEPPADGAAEPIRLVEELIADPVEIAEPSDAGGGSTLVTNPWRAEHTNVAETVASALHGEHPDSTTSTGRDPACCHFPSTGPSSDAGALRHTEKLHLVLRGVQPFWRQAFSQAVGGP